MEEIYRLIMGELDVVQPGCVSIIVGGYVPFPQASRVPRSSDDQHTLSYRRGKPQSNDVDIVFTHPDPEKEKGLCRRLVRRLYDQGTSLSLFSRLTH